MQKEEFVFALFIMQARFVAAFAQKEVGDASPNTDGSRCNETNEYCSYNTSICPENPNDVSITPAYTNDVSITPAYPNDVSITPETLMM